MRRAQTDSAHTRIEHLAGGATSSEALRREGYRLCVRRGYVGREGANLSARGERTVRANLPMPEPSKQRWKLKKEEKSLKYLHMSFFCCTFAHAKVKENYE